MWWGGNAVVLERAQSPKPRVRQSQGTTFSAPELDFGDDFHQCSSPDEEHEQVRSKFNVFKHCLSNQAPSIQLALPSASHDPFDAFDSVEFLRSSPKAVYWSSDNDFWKDWRAKEESARLSHFDKVKLTLEESQRKATEQAILMEKKEQDRRKTESEAKAKAEADAKTRSEVISSKPIAAPTSTPASAPLAQGAFSFEKVMEEGKKYRSEFMHIWREISVCVSATAGNRSSIQQNSIKLINALARASTQAGPGRLDVMTYLCAVCGSKLVTQASSGNKSLVWAFVYLAKLVSEKYPEVVQIGVIGELQKTCRNVLAGSADLRITMEVESSPKECEIHARMWVAMLCVMGDERNLWSWAASAVNQLLRERAFVNSKLALWNMMKVYVLLDTGMHDFRRVFGGQAVALIRLLEDSIFPTLDSALQSAPSTTASVQLRFYLDSCYNIIQARKHMSPPEGQALSAAAESELNPEL